MAVKFTEAHGVYWNHMVHKFAAGDEVPGGELANYLVAGGAPVEEIAVGPAVDEDGDGVPDGTITQVLEWVGDDHDRATAAFAAETAKGDQARKGLVTPLEALLSA